MTCSGLVVVLISKLCDVIIKASGTVISVVSPALTSLPAKSNSALIRNVAHCPNSQSRLPPSLLVTLIFLIVSTNFPLTVTPGVSAEVRFRPKAKSMATKQRTNEKILIFLVFCFILSSLFIKIQVPKHQYLITFNDMDTLYHICFQSKLSVETQPPLHHFILERNILITKLSSTQEIIAKFMRYFK